MEFWEKVKSWFSSCLKKNKEVETKQEEELKKQEATSEQRKEIASTIGTSIVDGVKVAMATLLSIFVPQYCPETGTTCTLADNFSNLTSFNEFVIFWNFLTLLLFFRLSYVANKREAYFIRHLDENRNKAYYGLTDNCKEYPLIIRRVKDHNKQLYFWTIILIFSFIVNVSISSALVCYFYYDGFRTATTLVGNTLLVTSKLKQIYNVCDECMGLKVLALSTVHERPISYNVIDLIYKKEDKTPGVYIPLLKLDERDLKSKNQKRQKRAEGKKALERLRSESVNTHSSLRFENAIELISPFVSQEKLIRIKNLKDGGQKGLDELSKLKSEIGDVFQAVKKGDFNAVKEEGLQVYKEIMNAKDIALDIKDNIEHVKEK